MIINRLAKLTWGKRKMLSSRKKGSSIVETAAGLIVLIPIFLFLIDAASVIVAQTSNDALCKQCARAAAECSDVASGTAAAQAIINNYNLGTANKLTTSSANPATCTVVGLPDAQGNQWQNVQCNTMITVNMPVPVPFTNLNNLKFQAQSVEPVVSAMATPNGASS
jgi:Flp pilus assembly protein TadG